MHGMIELAETGDRRKVRGVAVLEAIDVYDDRVHFDLLARVLTFRGRMAEGYGVQASLTMIEWWTMHACTINEKATL